MSKTRPYNPPPRKRRKKGELKKKSPKVFDCENCRSQLPVSKGEADLTRSIKRLLGGRSGGPGRPLGEGGRERKDREPTLKKITFQLRGNRDRTRLLPFLSPTGIESRRKEMVRGGERRKSMRLQPKLRGDNGTKKEARSHWRILGQAGVNRGLRIADL